MLLHIPDVLDAATLQQVQQLLADAPWADGRRTAGSQAQQAKHNQQLPTQSEASLAARAAARQAQLGRAWEDVARLMVAVRTGLDPLNLDVRVHWADTTTRSSPDRPSAIATWFPGTGRPTVPIRCSVGVLQVMAALVSERP